MGLGGAVGGTIDDVDLLAVNGVLLSGELIRIHRFSTGGGVELQTRRSRRVVHAIAYGHYRKHQQRTYLDDINGDVNRSGKPLTPR